MKKESRRLPQMWQRPTMTAYKTNAQLPRSRYRISAMCAFPKSSQQKMCATEREQDKAKMMTVNKHRTATEHWYSFVIVVAVVLPIRRCFGRKTVRNICSPEVNFRFPLHITWRWRRWFGRGFQAFFSSWCFFLSRLYGVFPTSGATKVSPFWPCETRALWRPGYHSFCARHVHYEFQFVRLSAFVSPVRSRIYILLLYIPNR